MRGESRDPNRKAAQNPNDSSFTVSKDAQLDLSDDDSLKKENTTSYQLYPIIINTGQVSYVLKVRIKHRKKSMTCVCVQWHWTPGHPSSWLWSCGCWHWGICARTKVINHWLNTARITSNGFSATAQMIRGIFNIFMLFVLNEQALPSCVFSSPTPFLPSSLHLAPKQQGIFSWFLLLVVFCLHTNVLDLSVEWKNAGFYYSIISIILY